MSERHEQESSSLQARLPLLSNVVLAGFLGAALSACAGDGKFGSEMPWDMSGEMMDRYQPHIVGENRLALNRLALNRLALNRLALNRLALNRLSDDRLSLNDEGGLVQTEDGRELLRYVAQCALADGDILVAEHEGVTYELPGLLGLATDWENEALSASGQRMLSACLLAHVNAFGVSVPISLRAGEALPTTPDERQQYAVYEGTFFGQVFEGDEIKTYSCQGSLSTAALEHSEDRALRVCTDAASDCAIESVGRCRDVCEQRREDEGWVNCRAHGVLYPETVSVYLFANNPDGMNQRCTGGHCRLDGAEGNAAILDCAATNRCDTDCDSDSTCTIDGALTHDLHVKVGAARFSEIDCYGTDHCDVKCREGASCDVDCTDTNNCKVSCSSDASCDIRCGGPDGNDCDDIKCREGAACLLRCDGASGGDDDDDNDSYDNDDNDRRFEHAFGGGGGGGNDCGFVECHAGAAVTCPGDIIVCGRPCP